MFYSLYSQTVDSKVPLDSFGIKRTEKPSSLDIIELDFIYCDANEKFEDYVNHQTHVSNEYGYYFIKNIALFEVFSGNKIVIKYFNEIDDDLIHSLLNYPFAMLFNQKKKYVIHASAVLFDEKVICFCGQTQSGKSSLASYLIKKGGLLISEDTCVFDYKNDNLYLLPSYNFIKISDAVNDYKDIFFSNPIKFLYKSTQRKGYILEDDKFSSSPIMVDSFIYLQWTNAPSDINKLDDEISLEMLLSSEFISFSKEDSSFRFKAATKLVNQADHYMYKRKKELSTLDDFINIFSEEF